MRSGRLLYLILITICCSLAFDTFCQPIENHFTHYTTKDGLPDGNIYDIKQDKTGFLWLATLNGLARFDGHNFKIFRHKVNDTTSLCENHINNIFIDDKERLWCASYNCLYLYHPDGEWFEHFVMDGYDVDRIYGEANDQLMLACSLKGLYKFDINKKTCSKYDCDRIDSSGCFHYLKDNDGIMWLSTRHGLIRFNPKTKQHRFIYLLDGGTVVLSDSFLLSGTYADGLILINRKTLACEHFSANKESSDSLFNGEISYLYRLNDSIVLVGTARCLTTFNWKRRTFSNVVPEKTNPDGLPQYNEYVNTVYSIFCDREGIIWVGGKTLERYDFKNFKINVLTPSGKGYMKESFFGCDNFFRCPDGKFLLGSFYGMSVYDPVNRQINAIHEKQFTVDSGKKFKYVGSFATDRQNHIWCLTAAHFCSFNIDNGHAINIHEYTTPFHLNRSQLVVDNKDRVLMGAINGGVIRFDPLDSSYTLFDTSIRSPARLTNIKVRSLCVAHDGSVWLGMQKGANKMEKDDAGLKQFGPDKRQQNTITNWIVNYIREDKHGTIWFSTLCNGIGRIDPANDSVSFLSIEQGLPTCLYSTICPDDHDNLWVMSQMGILRINTATLQNQLYTENEGFPAPGDIIAIQYSEYTRKLYVLTVSSIFEIDPDNSSYISKLPETIITAFSVFENERPLHAANAINLEYDENFIDIRFAALLFHSNEQIKYAYKMDGVDKDWVYCNFNRNAAYTNLAPGHYLFYVKAQGPDGIWNDKPTTLHINIDPPFWQTWWFYLAEIFAAIALAFWVLRIYTARKLAKQKNEIEKLQAVSNERTRIAADMHDELGAGLTSIRMLSEIAGGKIKQNIIAGSEIEKIERSATNLSENLREIIWTMNTRFDKLEDFIIYIRSYAVEYFEDSTMKFQFHSPDVIPSVTLNGELRRNLFLCIKEALNNIVKHAQATEAVLTFNIIGDILTIEIKDNGIGMDTPRGNKFGNGLNTMKERLNKFESDLEIDAAKGTKLTFKVNIKAN